ncbi:MAG: hypothetical protein NTZ18_04400 [Candidatus Komeilibacteria bacterium]|nr:hypothetical protein [Candidatus Komeilibacteria bacterium]
MEEEMKKKTILCMLAALGLICIGVLLLVPKPKTSPTGVVKIVTQHGVNVTYQCVSTPDSRFPQVIEVKASKSTNHFRIKFRIWAQEHYDSLITAIVDSTLINGKNSIPEQLVTWIPTK